MIKKHAPTILITIAASVLSCLLTLAFVNWFALPPASRVPIDMLTFTESAFGIGMTVIALVFALVIVNQVRDIDRRFAEIRKEIKDALKDIDSSIRNDLKAEGKLNALQHVSAITLEVVEDKDETS